MLAGGEKPTPSLSRHVGLLQTFLDAVRQGRRVRGDLLRHGLAELVHVQAEQHQAAELCVTVDDASRPVWWSRSSAAALRTGAYFRPRSGSPVEVPPLSLAARPGEAEDPKGGLQLGADVWFGSPSVEMAVVADAYDFTMSLVMLGDLPDRDWSECDGSDHVAVAIDERFGEHGQR